MAYRQMLLQFDPPKRLNAQCHRILDRLRRGPVTNSELASIAIRYSARIHELRRCGHTIEIVERNEQTWVFVYQLK